MLLSILFNYVFIVFVLFVFLQAHKYYLRFSMILTMHREEQSRVMPLLVLCCFSILESQARMSPEPGYISNFCLEYSFTPEPTLWIVADNFKIQQCGGIEDKMVKIGHKDQL